jgi:hypothetical protein
MRVQTKKKAPLESAMRLPAPTPLPLMWMTGTPNASSDMSRLITYPDRRSVRISAAYSQPTTMGIKVRLESPPCSNPRTMSSAR